MSEFIDDLDSGAKEVSLNEKRARVLGDVGVRALAHVRPTIAYDTMLSIAMKIVLPYASRLRYPRFRGRRGDRNNAISSRA